MSNAKGQGRPGCTRPNTHHQAGALDRELLDLERRKLVELRAGTVVLTRAGYREILKRAAARRS